MNMGTMTTVFGLLLLLLSLCGSGAQGEGGGAVGEIGHLQKTAARVEAEESTEQTTKQNISDIWGEVSALRDMVVELDLELSNTEAKVTENENQVNKLKDELTATKGDVALLQTETSAHATELASLEAKTSDLEKENTDLQTRLSNNEQELLAIKSRIDQLEAGNADKPKVAFYTALTNVGNTGPYNVDITLKYSKVFTNIGNGYNPSTGFFTAPVKGVYYFQFTVMGYTPGTMHVIVYKNNQRMMSNWASNKELNPEYFTNSLILEMEAGDEFHLVLPVNSIVYDDINNYSTFSGSLLFPL